MKDFVPTTYEWITHDYAGYLRKKKRKSSKKIHAKFVEQSFKEVGEDTKMLSSTPAMLSELFWQIQGLHDNLTNLTHAIGYHAAKAIQDRKYITEKLKEFAEFYKIFKKLHKEFRR